MSEFIRIVLVEPSHPGNIGGAARAMKTMGLQELVLVNPKRFPDPQADWRAAGALDVLDAARVVDSVDEAIADCHWVVGTSTRTRRIPWPVTDARGTAEQIHAQPAESRVAILFGREDNGLTNEELQRCNHHLQIPAAPAYSSLNLAMAVQVVCYEIFQQRQTTADATNWDRRMATAAELEGMVTHMEAALVDTGFLQADNPGQTMRRLRRLFTRVQMDETEVQIFRGICKHLLQSAQGVSGPVARSEAQDGNSGPK
ncbi:MAG: RNA methyltransferase [Pseudomonadota bacterium]